MSTNKKVTKVSGGESSSQKQSFVPTAEAKSKAGKLRLFGVISWVLAIAAQIGAIMVLLKSTKPIETNVFVLMIALIVVDLAFVIGGALLWKKANRLDPPSKKEKVKFFLQSQLGLISAIVAFLPLIIFIFINKDLDGKQKGILGGIAIVALLIAGVIGFDFNPPSVEEYTEQIQRVEELTGGNSVYWTKSGTKYHIYQDCQHINRQVTEEIFNGTVGQARELKNITELCATCENKAKREKEQ